MYLLQWRLLQLQQYLQPAKNVETFQELYQQVREATYCWCLTAQVAKHLTPNQKLFQKHKLMAEQIKLQVHLQQKEEGYHKITAIGYHHESM